MRLSIQRLRWVLLTGALLLVGVVALYIGYGRYRSIKAYRDILKRSGATMTHDTNGYTYSQSVQGKTIFTLHAKRATQLGDGKWTLYDAEMLLYNRSPDRPDRINSAEIDYDQKEGVARAKGEVRMDLQPPQTLTGAAKPGASPSQDAANIPPIIHVRTSGLVYLRKLGVATTDQRVEFEYGAVTCTALGAEFNTDQSTLNLLSNVVMDGNAHGQPVHLTATKADMDRNANVVHVSSPVVTSQERTARADASVLGLRKDGSIEDLLATGHVMMSSGTEQVTANSLYATLSPQTVLQTAKLSGNVLLTGTDPLRPIHGTANEVDAVFDTKGAPKSAVASGSVKVLMVDRKANPRGLMRSMEGAKIIALFVPVAKKGTTRKSSPQSAQLSEIHANGSAHMESETLTTASVSSKHSAAPKVPQLKTVQVSADDLRVLFAGSADGKAEPQKLFGEGHTQLEQDAPMDEQEISNGEALEMTFAPASKGDSEGLMLSHAVQSGHVSFHERAATKADPSKPGTMLAGHVSTGTADRAVYDEAAGSVMLLGNAHLNGNNGELIAPTVSLDQRTQDAEASGGVQATLRSVQSTGSGAPPAPITHVLAASARFFDATRQSEFHGTDAVPAKMWQDASQVQAATLLFDGVRKSLSARPSASGGLVHAVFAATPKPGAEPKKHDATRFVLVASPKMDYSDLQREATFIGGVTIDGISGEARSQRAVVFLTPDKTPEEKRAAPASPSAGPSGTFGGSLDRVVLSSEVQVEQPGRSGAGEQLLYTAATDNYVLTGTPSHPPHITDAKQGNVTGTALLFGDAGSTIVVVGEPGTKKRVRTETEVRQ